jgi:hypothetical protein
MSLRNSAILTSITYLRKETTQSAGPRQRHHAEQQLSPTQHLERVPKPFRRRQGHRYICKLETGGQEGSERRIVRREDGGRQESTGAGDVVEFFRLKRNCDGCKGRLYEVSCGVIG